ncbi:hypothetical protein BDR07DRAFT_1423634 [Suillus spraguei]|nr:hypothetical protein BDR07DRAFT_1423634 [Suillus spraguei]
MRISIILFITIPSIPYCNPMQHVVPYAEINSCFTPPIVYPSQRLLYLFPSHLTGRSSCGSLLHLPTTLSLGAGNEWLRRAFTILI